MLAGFDPTTIQDDALRTTVQNLMTWAEDLATKLDHALAECCLPRYGSPSGLVIQDDGRAGGCAPQRGCLPATENHHHQTRGRTSNRVMVGDSDHRQVCVPSHVGHDRLGRGTAVAEGGVNVQISSAVANAGRSFPRSRSSPLLRREAMVSWKDAGILARACSDHIKIMVNPC
jgi:hypothetical protein